MDVEAKRWPTFPALRALHLIVPKIFETSRNLYFEVLNTAQAPLKSQNSKKLVLLEETKEKCKVDVSPEFECQTQLNYC
jgi:hypothetical protein